MFNSDISSSLNSSTSSITSTIADIGAALIFGLGLYFFRNKLKKKDNKSEDEKDKIVIFKSKIIESIQNWDSRNSLEKLNSLIKSQYTADTFDPFLILDELQKNLIQIDISIINSILEITSNFGNYDHFIHLCKFLLFESVNCGFPEPNIYTYNIILKCYNNENFIKNSKINCDEFKLKADEILNLMEIRNCLPNEVTLNTIIDNCIDFKNLDLAWEYFDKMKKNFSLKPDIYTYSTLLKSIKQYDPNNKYVDKIFNILKSIKLSETKGIKQDELLYNCIIDTCIKYNKIKEAEYIYNDMLELGVTPSLITYGIMIKAYGNSYEIDKALEIFEKMKEKNIEPNDIIYGSLLNACIKSNKFRIAEEIFNDMKKQNFPLNNILYTTLIKGYTKAKNFDKAYEIFNELINDKEVKKNTISYNSILDSCIECGKFNMLGKIYEDFKTIAQQNESNPQPDLITYSTVIKGYCKMKNIEKVLDIYNFLQSKEEFEIDEVMFNTILDGLLKSEKYHEALKIYEHMKNKKTSRSNATYSILIKIYSKLNLVDNAWEIYNEMLNLSIKPSLITCTSIIQILIKSKRIQKAIDIFNELIAEGAQPDQVMYNVIINGCVFNGRLQDACDYLFQTFEKNIKICNDVYKNILCNLLTNKIMEINHKIQMTIRICKEIKERQIEIDNELFSKVMKMIYKNSNKIYDKKETYGNNFYQRGKSIYN